MQWRRKLYTVLGSAVGLGGPAAELSFFTGMDSGDIAGEGGASGRRAVFVGWRGRLLRG